MGPIRGNRRDSLPFRRPAPRPKGAALPARLRKTKVIATIGPACDSPDTLRRMIEAGMNVARLNLSHGTLAEHKARLHRVREACRELSANVAVMLDTKGTEIRTGLVRNAAVELVEGDPFVLTVTGGGG